MTIDGSARIAGVIGWPIHHSLSPVLHNHWLTKAGINGAYIPMAVRPDQLEPALRALPMLGLRGTNVTVPHKETAMRLMDTLSPVAERIGAVNTITVAEDGSLHGDNTDAFGFIENLKRGAPDLTFKNVEILVIGSGGAARGGGGLAAGRRGKCDPFGEPHACPGRSAGKVYWWPHSSCRPGRCRRYCR